MIKKKTRSFLTAILAILCAVLLGCSVAVFNGINNKTASAATDLYDNGKLSEAALNGIAQAAGYTDFNGMKEAVLDNNATLKATNFGSYTVTFGGIEWWPVYATASDGELVLTLWLKQTLGLLPICDGTYSSTRLTTASGVNVSTNNYATSWLHAYLNAGVTSATGKTAANTYIGGYSGSSYREVPTSSGSNGKAAPTNYTTFKEFVPEGAYADFIVPDGETGDNVWLVTLDQIKANGTWGCTKSPHWGNLNSRSDFMWTRTTDGGAYKFYGLRNTGASATGIANVTHNVRPAINVNLTGTSKVKEPVDVVKPYTGSAYSRTDIAGDWYKSDLMDVDWPTNMIDAGEKKIKVTLNAQAREDGITFKGTPGEGENEYTRYFKFTITKKNVSISWDEEKHVGQDLYFLLPTLKVTPEVKELLKDNGEVKYYLEGDYDTANKKPTGTEVALADIDEGKNYVAAVEIDTDKTKNNYEISGSVYYSFNTTDNRTLVYVSLTKTEDTYNDDNQLLTSVKITDKNGVELTDISHMLTYRDSEGNESSSAPSKAGTYTVVVSLQPSSNEEYKIGEKEFTYVINKAEPNALYKPYTDKLYKGGALPEIETDILGGGTPGTFTPEPGYKLDGGTGKYPYTFTPTDTENFKTITVQVVLTTEAAILDKIEATFETTETVYTSWTETDIKKYLTVTAYYTNGDEIVLSGGDYSVKGSLSAGDNQTLIVELTSDKEKTCEVVINGVVKSVLEEISSVVVLDKLYSSNSSEDLKTMLSVKGKYNDGKDHPDLGGFTIEVDSNCVDKNGNLKAGTGIAVTITYIDRDNANNELTYNLTIDVAAVKLANLTIEFDAGPYEITSTTNNATLIQCLTVIGEYNDGKIEELALDESEITTKVNGTTLTITVTRDGVSESYDVTIPEVDNSKTFTLTVPELEATFTGEEIDILKDWQFANLIASGDVEVTGNKKTNAGPWDLTITIKNSAYKWPEVAKAAMKYALADGEAEVGYTIEGATLTATWRIAKAVVKGSWNDQGTLDVVCAGYTGDVNALIKYTYYKDGVEVDTSSEPLIVGQKYTVTAELVDSSNFEFDGATAELVSEPHEFTMRALPTGGFTATWNKITEVMVQKYAGLPLWAWLLIGLALLILLIIIIVVACKRKKNKEERKEEKARREEERRMQQERLQAERDLAKAKQEAELERIKAQAQMAAGMAGMGMASMTMQMPQQQAIPTAMPQQQPVQQQAQPQMQPMVQQMSQSQPVMQQSAPAQASGGVGATEMMAMMFAQFAGMKADAADKEIAALKSEKEITALKTEIEIMKLKLEQMKESKPVGDLRELTPEFLGAAIVSAMRGNGNVPQHTVAELPAPETETATSSAVYPPDAVVTTTTTVDTTKFRNGDGVTDKAGRRESRNGKADFDDIDGFYDSID